jgi:CO/xanthine dehydrogenase FAD-binding subunit
VNEFIMKPAQFAYYAPASIAEVRTLLDRYGADARVLAGGQTLLPMMNFRLAVPEVVIDLNRVPELSYIKVAGDHVCIGAMTRQRTVEFSSIIAEMLPLLRDAVRMVGHLPTRSRGTIGGSIANADSAAELPMMLQVLDGTVIAMGPAGVREISATDFLLDAMTTSLSEGEIITEVRFRVMPRGARFAIEEVSRRVGDFAVAAIAVSLVIEDERCKTARIATAGISSFSTRLLAAEKVLEGTTIDKETIARAAAAAAAAVQPISDRHASREYRQHLTKVLTVRAIEKAMM